MIDALLFVFGKRANQLRHNKVSELIHHSDQHTDLSYCKVSVYFQEIIDGEGENFDIVENSQTVVARVGDSKNGSKYYMNNKHVKFEDVENWLNSKGISLDNNRFLILQVSQYIENKERVIV